MTTKSLTEREFLTAIIRRGKRLDGRLLTESRDLNINFLQEWGSCRVKLGNTVVLSQVTAEITAPKKSRPTEGVIHLNLQFSSMYNYVSSKSENLHLQRSLQRCLVKSGCVDLESLCLIAGLKVWRIFVDIIPLNDDGNLLECCNIAAVCALAHFKRPDVSIIGTNMTRHPLDVRQPVCLNINHMPIAVNMAILSGESVITDPTKDEEMIADGFFYVCANIHHEICFVSKRGGVLLSKDAVEDCKKLAMNRVQKVTEEIRSALDRDVHKRSTNVGTYLGMPTILSHKATIYRSYLKESETKSEEISTCHTYLKNPCF